MSVPTGIFDGVEWWQVVERASWVIVITASVIGVPFAYIQLRLLRKDQKRIADDLARRPRLDVGFFPTRKVGAQNIPSPTLHIQPSWNRGQELSEPVTVQMACCNNGDRTAHEVVYNMAVQEGFEMAPLDETQREHVVRSPITNLDMWVEKDDYVHPGDIAAFETTAAVRRGRKKVDYRIEISHDYGSQDIDLSIIVDEVPS